MLEGFILHTDEAFLLIVIEQEIYNTKIIHLSIYLSIYLSMIYISTKAQREPNWKK